MERGLRREEGVPGRFVCEVLWFVRGLLFLEEEPCRRCKFVGRRDVDGEVCRK